MVAISRFEEHLRYHMCVSDHAKLLLSEPKHGVSFKDARHALLINEHFQRAVIQFEH